MGFKAHMISFDNVMTFCRIETLMFYMSVFVNSYMFSAVLADTNYKHEGMIKEFLFTIIGIRLFLPWLISAIMFIVLFFFGSYYNHNPLRDRKLAVVYYLLKGIRKTDEDDQLCSICDQ